MDNGSVFESLRGLFKRSRTLELGARTALSLLPYRFRQSRAFWSYYALLQEHERSSLDDLRTMQTELVLSMLKHAYQRSGFYRRLYDAAGIQIGAIKTLEDFSRTIPVVSRDDLIGVDDVGVPMRGLGSGSTSGTTGTPFVFAMDSVGTDMEKAAIYYQWQRVGFRPGDFRVEMRGYQREAIVPYPDHRVARFSVISMEPNLDRMVDYLDRNEVRFIHGYPSAIAKFALLLRESRRSLKHGLKAVLFASENVYDWQVRIVEEQLRPQFVAAHYGNAERTGLGAWCETSRRYHFLTPYSFVERDSDGTLIGTSFLNHATPFVRYRVNDVALDWDVQPCAACGRSYVPLVEKIGGRLEDYLVSAHGELIPPAVVTFPFKSLEAIKGVQIVQQENRDVTLFCITEHDREDDSFQHDMAKLRGQFEALLGGVRIDFEIVDELALTASGKMKWVVSHAAPLMDRE